METLRSGPLVAMTLCCFFGSATAIARDDDHDHKGVISTQLSGYNEVHFVATPTPALRGAVSTKATGTFKAVIDDAPQLIHYELNYQGLEGAVTQAHIHFGQRHTVGGIVVWLCQTAGPPAPASVAALTPICPPNTVGDAITGTIVPSQVLPQMAQGIDVGEFDELVRAIRAGATYANVHSTLFPPGEIRGQLNRQRRRD